MTEADRDIILGKILAAHDGSNEKLDRIIRVQDEDRRVNGATRDMVLRHDTGLRLGKLSFMAIIAAVGALGFDRWRG